MKLRSGKRIHVQQDAYGETYVHLQQLCTAVGVNRTHYHKGLRIKSLRVHAIRRSREALHIHWQDTARFLLDNMADPIASVEVLHAIDQYQSQRLGQRSLLLGGAACCDG